MSIITEGGAGVLQGHSVGGVSGGEGVSGSDGFFHEVFTLFASSDGFFILDLGLSTPHRTRLRLWKIGFKYLRLS